MCVDGCHGCVCVCVYVCVCVCVCVCVLINLGVVVVCRKWLYPFTPVCTIPPPLARRSQVVRLLATMEQPLVRCEMKAVMSLEDVRGGVTSADGPKSNLVELLADELLMCVLGLVDTQSLLTAAPAVCRRWHRLCRRLHRVKLDLSFLNDNPRVMNGDCAVTLTALSKQWTWVDAVFVDGWRLADSDAAILLDIWPKLTTIRCGK